VTEQEIRADEARIILIEGLRTGIFGHLREFIEARLVEHEKPANPELVKSGIRTDR